MTISDSLLPEFDHEMATTRRMLERVPETQHDWQPHEKSLTLGRLASHLAEMPDWAVKACTCDELDFAPKDGPAFKPRVFSTNAELVEALDTNVAVARDHVAKMSDGDWMRDWSLLAGGEKIFTLPKIGVMRSMVMNHIIHHRGQLSVYLRLLGVALPPVYGPTADEQGM